MEGLVGHMDLESSIWVSFKETSFFARKYPSLDLINRCVCFFHGQFHREKFGKVSSGCFVFFQTFSRKQMRMEGTLSCFSTGKKPNSGHQPMPNNKLFPNVCCWSQWWLKPIRKNKKNYTYFLNLFGRVAISGWHQKLEKTQTVWERGGLKGPPGSVVFKKRIRWEPWDEYSPILHQHLGKYVLKNFFFQPPNLRKSITLNERKLILETSHFPLAWVWGKG